MKDISAFNKIYLATRHVDFRKQAHSLALLVDHTFKIKAIAPKTLFVFTNRRRTAIKILYWDGTGFALWWKGLEKDRFRWPKHKDEALNLTSSELMWLLEGVDITKIKKHSKLLLD